MRSVLAATLLSCLATGAVEADRGCAALPSSDLKRAMTKVPRAAYQGSSSSMNGALNRHLLMREDLTTRDCAEFSANELHELLQELKSLSEPQLLAIYEEASDRRLPSADSAQPGRMLAGLAAESPELHDMLRDGLCHKVVLSFVHHLASGTQRSLAQKKSFVLPLLPHQGLHAAPVENSARGRMVFDEYSAAVTCQICHGQAGPETTGEAPSWPPVVAPVWPYQFEAESSAWTQESNMTLYGSWHYDFLNNRMAQYYFDNASGFNLTQVWLANPVPAGESNASEVYGPGAERGVFYIFMSPARGVPTTCSMYPYPGFSIVHPDSFSSSTIGSENVEFAGRVKKEDKWVDHFKYNFSISPGNPCNGVFELFKDIHDHLPVNDYGPNGCGTDNLAITKWWNLERQQPPLWRFMHNFTSCKKSSSFEELEADLVRSLDKVSAVRVAESVRAASRHGLLTGSFHASPSVAVV